MNEIHPTVIIEGDVKLGQKNRILPYTILRGPLEIGDNNIIGPHVVIGSPGADTRNPRYDDSNCKIKIGHNNIIREFTAIQKPCYEDITSLGNNIFLMQSTSIAHDTHIEDDVVITAMCAIAGLTRIHRGAYLGMGCTLNQRNIIGAYSIVATGAPTMKKVLPFSRYIPGQKVSVNKYAIKKFGFEPFMNEIARYVTEGIRPSSEQILNIVEAFDTACAQSPLEIYRN